jgi:putative ABC transport system permease protein
VPDWQSAIARHLSARGLDHTRHFGVIEELAQHLDDRYRSLRARGVETAAAETTVLQELAENDAIVRELRVAERTAPITRPPLGGPAGDWRLAGWWQDLRYAARALWTAPGFSLVAIVTLALAIGATTAIFSVVNAVMLRPLPFDQPDRLIRVWESSPERGWPEFSASYPNFLDWRAQATSWTALAAQTGASFSMTSHDGAQLVRGLSATLDFLPALGVAPVLGRNFLPDEDRPGGNTRVVILSDGFWRRAFAGDPAIVGRAVSLNGAPYTVVGVLPPGFEWGPAMDLIVPLAPDPARSRGDHRLIVIGRLRDGVSMTDAHNELSAIAAALAQAYPASNEGWGVRLATFYDWIVPAETRESLLVLLGAVALVLLIACGNVANLLLSRGAARQKELAIRVALGAARGRIARQLLVESLLLAVIAAAGGVAMALVATRLLVAVGPSTTVPRLDELSIDATVLGFAVLTALVSALVFGLLPALQLARSHPGEALQDGSRGSTGGRQRQRLRAALTVAEVALSVALLIGAGLLLRSFWRLQQVDAGFDVSSTMAMRVTLPRTTYDTGEKSIAFYDRLRAEIGTLPGLAGVATTSGPPLAPGNTSTEIDVPGRIAAPGEPRSADWRLASPGYFATMGIPLRGRDFTAQDGPDAPPVTIVNETLARRLWPAEDPIGKIIHMSSFGNRTATIVGVAGDVHSFGLDAEHRPMVYLSSFVASWPAAVVWRSHADPASHVNAIRDIVRRLDPAVPVHDVTTFESLLAESLGPRRFNLYLLATFAAIALAMAAIGLFGVMAYLVSQRTREIGVRLALGASRYEIFRLIIGRGVTLAALGAVIGLAGAIGLTRWLESLLFSVSRTDPGTFAAVPVLLVLVAILACYVPARRAMRVDPMIALRAE